MAIYPVKHVSWDEVVEWSFRLAEKIRVSGFKPGVVVAVGRGGYVVARLLCDILDVDKSISIPIKWVSRRGGNYLADLIRCFYRFRGQEVNICISNVVKGLDIEISPSVSADLRGLTVLAVEEVSATGMHLAKAREYLRSLGAEDVKTATLVWKAQTSTLRPDYVFIESRGFVWFQFPWSRLSDYQQFIRVALEEESRARGKQIYSYDEVIEIFVKWYGFKPDEKYLREALKRLNEDRFISMDVEKNVIVVNL